MFLVGGLSGFLLPVAWSRALPLGRPRRHSGLVSGLATEQRTISKTRVGRPWCLPAVAPSPRGSCVPLGVLESGRDVDLCKLNATNMSYTRDNKTTMTSDSAPEPQTLPEDLEDAERLQQRLTEVRERVDAAAANVGRPVGSVRILPVSKFVPIQRMRILTDLGVDTFGESRVQELREKAVDMADLDIDWVFIGRLQTNKAGQAARIVSEVQSVSSTRLAASLSRTTVAWQNNPENPAPQDLRILLQVNTSGEETKSGFAPEEVDEAISEIMLLPGLQLRGFMTMAPHVDDDDEVRRSFARLREVRDDMADRYKGELALPELSMGMSHDYEIAVEEGATVVRLGTVLFGDRYS